MLGFVPAAVAQSIAAKAQIVKIDVLLHSFWVSEDEYVIIRFDIISLEH